MSLPAAFVPNVGQWPESVRFWGSLGSTAVIVKDDGWVFAVDTAPTPVPTMEPRQKPAPRVGEPVVFGVTFPGCSATPPVGHDTLCGVNNYFLGSDPAAWRTAVPRFGSILHPRIYPGVDLLLSAQAGRFAYQFILHPGAATQDIQLLFDGAVSPSLSADGALRLTTPAGVLTQSPPSTSQAALDGALRPATSVFVRRSPGRFGVQVTDVIPPSPPVATHGLTYSTLFGGSGSESIIDVVTASSGLIYFLGNSTSQDLRTSVGAFAPGSHGNYDAFVACLDPRLPPQSQLLYCTYLGGERAEYAWELLVDPSGVITITGVTQSYFFPTTVLAYSRSLGGSDDAFLATLDPAVFGYAQLRYSTFFGGSDGDAAFHLQALGSMFVFGGFTQSIDMPITSLAWDTQMGGTSDGFIAILAPQRSPQEQLVYSTYVGGSSPVDVITGILVCPPTVIVVACDTDSPDLPTTPGALNTRPPGGLQDTSVLILDLARPPSQQLIYGTYLGGAAFDYCRDLSIDVIGAITVAGFTNSPDFPTTPTAFQPFFAGGPPGNAVDGFLLRLRPFAPRLRQLQYSTYVGGTGRDFLASAATDSTGVVTMCGNTDSGDFPITPGALQTVLLGLPNADGFILRLDPLAPAGRQVRYSTYFGSSSGPDAAVALAVTADGSATVVGAAISSNFPVTPNAWQLFSRGQDGFVAQLTLLPRGVTSFGASTPGNHGPLAMGTLSTPQSGNGAFALVCGAVPPLAVGAAFLSSQRLASPLVYAGAEVWVDPFSMVSTIAAPADARGVATTSLPVPSAPHLIGQTFYAQYFWPPAPSTKTLAASNALSITIQP